MKQTKDSEVFNKLKKETEKNSNIEKKSKIILLEIDFILKIEKVLNQYNKLA